jgi:modulator of FtsH protease HflK
VIVDQSGQGVVPYLPLPGLTPRPAPATTPEGTKQ